MGALSTKFACYLRKLPFETVITLYQVKLDFKDLCTLSALFRFQSHTGAQTSSDFLCVIQMKDVLWDSAVWKIHNLLSTGPRHFIVHSQQQHILL